MRKETTCKFCRKPVFIEIDDEYAKLGDPMNLIRLAACNRCADLRDEKRKLEDKINVLCTWLLQLSEPGRIKARDKALASFTRVTEKYASLVASWLNGQKYFDSSFPESLFNRPDDWPNIISAYWKICREANPPRLEI